MFYLGSEWASGFNFKPMLPSAPPENIRKPEFFWYFQGVQKNNIDLKLAKANQTRLQTTIVKHVIEQNIIECFRYIL